MHEIGSPAPADVVKANVSALRERIRAGGGDDRIRIVAITKGFSRDAIAHALKAGIRDVGENYAQEMIAKLSSAESLLEKVEATDSFLSPGDSLDRPPGSGLRRHFVGRLQRNKVRKLVPYVDVWQTIDSLALVEEVARHAPGAHVFIQVDLAGQIGRGGCSWEDTQALVSAARNTGLDVRGLMGVGPPGNPEDSRPPFRRLTELAGQLDLTDVSAGMSDDLDIAIEEGATLIRVGRALFGNRR